MGFGDDSADFSRALDEAFSSGGPSRNIPPRTKSGSRHRPRNRSPPAGDRSVNSQGSSGGEGERERGGGSGRGPAPGRGVARQRSQRRASIAAAVSLMATGGVGDNQHSSRGGGGGGFDATTVEDHVNAARAERRIPRRTKHEDRLQAASMAGPMGAAYDQSVNSDRYTDDNDYDGHGSDRRGHERHGSGGGISGRSHRHHHPGSSQDLGYDDEYYDNDVEEYDVPENHQHPTSRTERLRSGRRPRRAVSDEDPYTHHHHSEEADRRSRFAGKGPNRSFDEAATNVRSRGRRRASMMGGPVGAVANAAVEEELNPVAAGLRARRARRASMVSGEGPAVAAPSRGEPVARGVRESRSAARMRRATMSTSMAGADVQDFPGVAGSVSGYSAADNDFMMDQSQQDDTYYSSEKQEWAEQRADKQRAMLERLRKSKKEEQAAGSGGEEDESEEEPEPAPEPEATKTPTARPRRRASLGILGGMSTTKFPIVDDDGTKERKKEEKARQKAEKAEKKRPGRSKSTDGGIPVPAVPSRARATDRDRRRPGTMLDRIGA